MDARALAPLFLLAAACSHAEHHSASSQTTVGGAAGSVLVTEGVKIEITDSVRYELNSVSTNAGSSRTETIDGHPFGVRDGVFYIGDVTYGAVASGEVVKVSAEGVFVGAEKRGVVPAKIEK